ncbi:hypothetical protein VTL71DRAFT_11118 [Oculimacula yallundae]|uniref:F-box domain-containing protein n=1 Tax=Oculimacula yallundae TaxID=86028 RepID=A0ABR4CVC8_9HELO
MDTLPPELLHLILTHVPKSSLPSLRLLNHTFESIAFPLLFKNLLNWLDYNTSHAAITAFAHDVHNRPAAMWSPCASEPDGDVEGMWLGIIWRLQMKTGTRTESKLLVVRTGEEMGGAEGVTGAGELLTAENYARLSGKEDMLENRLKVAQNSYLMHRSYCDGTLKAGGPDVVVESKVVLEENGL